MLITNVYDIQPKNKKKLLASTVAFFCFLKGSRKVMIHPSWVVCSKNYIICINFQRNIML